MHSGLKRHAPIINKSLIEVSDPEKLLEYSAVAITRNGRTIIPRGNDRFETGDMVYVISNKGGVKNLLRYTGKENMR